VKYLLDLVSVAPSVRVKIFIPAVCHEMKIIPLDDGKRMDIIIADGASYKTKGAKDFVKN